MGELVIRSEKDAFDWLEQYLAGNVEAGELKLENWPTLSIRLNGDQFDQSLTPSIMKGFIELQGAINRSYALSKYGVANGGRLSAEERAEIEVRVKVEKGSTLLGIDFNGIVNNVAMKAVETMEPTHIIAMTLGVGVIWASQSVFKKYLDDRREVRMSEAKTEAERESLATLKFMSAEETKRVNILTSLIKNNAQLENASRHADDARGELLKSFSKADTTEFDGLIIDSETAADLATNARRKSEEVRLDGLYRILRNDTTDPTAFRIKVRSSNRLQEFEALVQTESLNYDYKKLLQEAEWSRTLVKLSINAKSLEGEIRNAVVVGVKPSGEEQEE